jgi:hypothetical protein
MMALVPSRAPGGIRVRKAIAPLVLLLSSFCCQAVAAPLPNIDLMMGDDHGWEETGYNGHWAWPGATFA